MVTRLWEWLSDLKLVAVVIVASIGYFLWMLTVFTLWFVNPLYNVLWIPLPVIIALLVAGSKRGRRLSDVEKAEREHAKTKSV